MTSSKSLITLLLLGTLTGCISSQPGNIANVCSIFESHRGWHKAAQRTEQRWGVPVPVSMAFVYQESSFQARAKPARTRILWVIPGPRPSSAYGFAQALDSTWADYMRATGNTGARRTNFSDAIDFIGWYNATSYRVNGIGRHDARNLYLPYHQGHTGFANGSYRGNQWLLDTAAQVQSNADRFSKQYARCARDLERGWFSRLFS
ncbi:MAG: hypothetical protein RLZZ385_2054 [Pseudomonadota bacterium]|jgi:hypothetical protein